MQTTDGRNANIFRVKGKFFCFDTDYQRYMNEKFKTPLKPDDKSVVYYIATDRIMDIQILKYEGIFCIEISFNMKEFISRFVETEQQALDVVNLLIGE